MDNKMMLPKNERSLNLKLLVSFGKNLSGLWCLFATYYFKPFSTSRIHIILGVLSFAMFSTLNWILCHTGLINNGIYETEKNQLKLVLETKIAHPQPIYEVKMSFHKIGASSKLPVCKTVSLKFNEWIAADGEIEEQAVFKDMESHLTQNLQFEQ